MVRFPDSETDERGEVRHQPLKPEPNIRDVTEGPIVGALVSVFRQLEEMGVKRNGRE